MNQLVTRRSCVTKLWVQKAIYSANQKVTLLTISYDNVDNERIVNW